MITFLIFLAGSLVGACAAFVVVRLAHLREANHYVAIIQFTEQEMADMAQKIEELQK